MYIRSNQFWRCWNFWVNYRRNGIFLRENQRDFVIKRGDKCVPRFYKTIQSFGIGKLKLFPQASFAFKRQVTVESDWNLIIARKAFVSAGILVCFCPSLPNCFGITRNAILFMKPDWSSREFHVVEVNDGKCHFGRSIQNKIRSLFSLFPSVKQRLARTLAPPEIYPRQSTFISGQSFFFFTF